MEDAIAGERIGALGEDFGGGAAREDTDFEGTEDAVAVVGVDALGGFGVKASEEAGEVRALFEAGAEKGVSGGAGGEAAEEGAEIKAGASAEDGETAAGRYFREKGFDVAGEVGGGEGFVSTTDIEEMMGGREAVGEGEFGGADIEAAEELEGVAVNDLAVEVAREGEGEGAFAGTGGPDDGEEG